MTNDRDLLRVLVAAEAARAKVVLVGDDRQLGPVGPGGALAGLLDRAHHAVHVLDENVRQADPGERRALEQLRAGDVDRAVAWYARNERITVASTRDDALDAMVNAWLADTRSGLNSGLYAWRRDNVAALNTRGPDRLGRRRPPQRPRTRSARRAPLRRRRPHRHPRPRRRRGDRDQRTRHRHRRRPRPPPAGGPHGRRPRPALRPRRT